MKVIIEYSEDELSKAGVLLGKIAINIGSADIYCGIDTHNGTHCFVLDTERIGIMTDIEKLALRISKQKRPCKKCIYCNDEWCKMPYSDATVIENKINPCAEGIYKWLMEQERKKKNGFQADTEAGSR